jgi:CubicO group peptidase (beta-lactamase class C family)
MQALPEIATASCVLSLRSYKSGVLFGIRRAFAAILLLLLVKTRGLAADIQRSDCAQAAKYSDSKRGVSMLVMQNGKTIFEHYANGGRSDGAWPIFSGTKSFWGIAALAAVGQGLFKLDDPACDTITEWRSDPIRSQITIRELLNATDGIDGAPHLHRASLADRNAVALRVPIVARPGSVFVYGPSHLQIFGELLRRKLNGHNIISFMEGRVLQPLGIGSVEYKKDARGNPLLASGFELSAQQWARLGELVLGHGSYHGRQIVSAELLRQAFVGSEPNPSYGLTVWLNRAAGFMSREEDVEKMLDLPWQRASWGSLCICKSAPADMIVALGSGYQRLFILPSMNALIVRQGQNAKFSDAYFLRLVLGRR